MEGYLLFVIIGVLAVVFITVVPWIFVCCFLGWRKFKQRYQLTYAISVIFSILFYLVFLQVTGLESFSNLLKHSNILFLALFLLLGNAVSFIVRAVQLYKMTQLFWKESVV
jgi:low affinity Fe/Cu permease